MVRFYKRRFLAPIYYKLCEKWYILESFKWASGARWKDRKYIHITNFYPQICSRQIMISGRIWDFQLVFFKLFYSTAVVNVIRIYLVSKLCLLLIYFRSLVTRG